MYILVLSNQPHHHWVAMTFIIWSQTIPHFPKYFPYISCFVIFCRQSPGAQCRNEPFGPIVSNRWTQTGNSAARCEKGTLGRTLWGGICKSDHLNLTLNSWTWSGPKKMRWDFQVIGRLVFDRFDPRYSCWIPVPIAWPRLLINFK